MGRRILITGGCRSGKSRHALELSHSFEGERVFIATAEPFDDEMKERVSRHKEERGDDWRTVEEPVDLASVFKSESKTAGVLLLDCMTLWLSNLLLKDYDADTILKHTQAFIEQTASIEGTLIVVTNEVGAGIVPENALARSFRDLAGEMNQRLAVAFDEVIHVVCGIPTTIKKNEDPSAQPALTHTDAFSSEHKQGVYEAIYKRRDMRHFDSRPVDPETLGRVLSAAHHAGSVGFMQPWNFLVIDQPEIKQRIADNFKKANDEASKHFEGDKKALYDSLKLEAITDAPLNICVTCDSSRQGPHVLGRNTMPETDLYSTCCAVQNLWLAARAEGLAVGWVSILSKEQLKSDLGIPESIEPVAYLCVGHTDRFYEKPMLEETGWADRIGLQKLIYYNQWEGGPDLFSVRLPGDPLN